MSKPCTSIQGHLARISRVILYVDHIVHGYAQLKQKLSLRLTSTKTISTNGFVNSI